jgi:site-specific recombinase XerC
LTFNPANERIKHRYLAFLGEAKRFSSSSVDQVAAAVADFEASTGFKDFKQFRIEHAQSYKRKLGGAVGSGSGRALAKATISSRLAALKAFFQWLAQQPGFRSRFSYSDAEYFNASANDERIAKAVRQRPVPSVEQIQHVLNSMPSQSDIERRNQALIAFALLSGARDNAMASMSLKHIDLPNRRVYQDAREVRTKNAKTITSTFFPVGADIEVIVENWVRLLKLEGRRRDTQDIQGRFRGRGTALFQSAQLPQHVGKPWREDLSDSRSVQGMEPKPRPCARADDLHKLRLSCGFAPGRDFGSIVQCVRSGCWRTRRCDNSASD